MRQGQIMQPMTSAETATMHTQYVPIAPMMNAMMAAEPDQDKKKRTPRETKAPKVTLLCASGR